MPARGGKDLSEWLQSLATLPAVPLYCSIGLLAAVENVIPPVPADTVVALGAFLAAHGLLDPWTVFAVTWVGNVASAALVYLVGRHYGRAFFAGPIGRRLISEETLAHIEAAYARHGSYGIFLSRLLPVWRGVVPPFAGIARVPAWRALVPIALASALWYGAIILLVVRLAPTLDQAIDALGRVNKILGIAALVVVLVLVGLIWLRRRRRRSGL